MRMGKRELNMLAAGTLVPIALVLIASKITPSIVSTLMAIVATILTVGYALRRAYDAFVHKEKLISLEWILHTLMLLLVQSVAYCVIFAKVAVPPWMSQDMAQDIFLGCVVFVGIVILAMIAVWDIGCKMLAETEGN